MKIKIKKLAFDAKVPVYATDGSGCFDIYSNGVYRYDGDTEIHKTGIAFDIPEDYVMLIFSRSGQGFNENTRLANCVGVIDSDFTGEVKVKLKRDDGGRIVAKYGDRIAQGFITPRIKVEFEEVDELKATERGDKGFGSTGV